MKERKCWLLLLYDMYKRVHRFEIIFNTKMNNFIWPLKSFIKEKIEYALKFLHLLFILFSSLVHSFLVWKPDIDIFKSVKSVVHIESAKIVLADRENLLKVERWKKKLKSILAIKLSYQRSGYLCESFVQ